MNQLELTNKFEQWKQYAESEIKLIAGQALTQLKSAETQVQTFATKVANDIEVTIENDLTGIKVNGHPIDWLTEYDTLMSALHKLLGQQTGSTSNASAVTSNVITDTSLTQVNSNTTGQVNQALPAEHSANSDMPVVTTTGFSNIAIPSAQDAGSNIPPNTNAANITGEASS